MILHTPHVDQTFMKEAFHVFPQLLVLSTFCSQVTVTVSVQQIFVMCTFLWVLCWRFSLHKTMTSSLKLQSQKTYEQIMEPSYPHLNHRY